MSFTNSDQALQWLNAVNTASPILPSTMNVAMYTANGITSTVPEALAAVVKLNDNHGNVSPNQLYPQTTLTSVLNASTAGVLQVFLSTVFDFDGPASVASVVTAFNAILPAGNQLSTGQWLAGGGGGGNNTSGGGGAVTGGGGGGAVTGGGGAATAGIVLHLFDIDADAEALTTDDYVTEETAKPAYDIEFSLPTTVSPDTFGFFVTTNNVDSGELSQILDEFGEFQNYSGAGQRTYFYAVPQSVTTALFSFKDARYLSTNDGTGSVAQYKTSNPVTNYAPTAALTTVTASKASPGAVDVWVNSGYLFGGASTKGSFISPFTNSNDVSKHLDEALDTALLAAFTGVVGDSATKVGTIVIDSVTYDLYEALQNGNEIVDKLLKQNLLKDNLVAFEATKHEDSTITYTDGSTATHSTAWNLAPAGAKFYIRAKIHHPDGVTGLNFGSTGPNGMTVSGTGTVASPYTYKMEDYAIVTTLETA